MDVISLTKKLISFNTSDPPGNEEEIAKYVGNILKRGGFSIEYPKFGGKRIHLIAEKGISAKRPPIVLSGHFDTVPPGNRKWSVDPFKGKVSEGKIWGRGSSDMKGGLAAMIIACVEVSKDASFSGGIRIIFTAGEELGCHGVSKLVKEYKGLGNAGAVIVGEPTSNLPVIAHKGALYLRAVESGRTAHSSMPQLGINAIYKAAESVAKLMNFSFEAENDSLLGYPTLNVGTINGGMNINSVPDHTEFTIDIRTTSKLDHDSILNKLANRLGDDTVIEKLVDIDPLVTPEDDPFIKIVYEACCIKKGNNDFPKTLPYLTDGAVLQKYYNNVPVVIIGPGEPELAHQTDEFCYIDKLEQAIIIYEKIILKWCK
jgi:succinyl-diaminopimelate desuccinylase